ncbi:MAG: WecB/TagA/CpsF family glycosyltransferase [Nitrospirae bacterium]|nr:WecB/TagA/CpsF family glycosyltransferase [Nitrospirota bacterium]
MKPERIEILGVPVDCVTRRGAMEAVAGMLAGETARTIVAVNPEKVIRALRDRELLDAMRNADLLIPDGIGVVLAARLLNLGRMERVPGSELMPEICGRAAREGRPIFLFGSSPEVNARVEEVLRGRFPGIRIAGREHGYLPEGETAALLDRIDGSGADVVFVALGSPRQEIWMDRHRSRLRARVCQGVGGTFDVIAGRVRRAPLLFRRIHLEWLYRLLAQPDRILRQTALPRFAFAVLWKRVFG